MRERLALGDAFLNTLVPNPCVGLVHDAPAQFGQVTETPSNDPRFIHLAFRYSFQRR